jgi:DNA/RNA-binding domain of Phe-tRNA-synthetase-like protein
MTEEPIDVELEEGWVATAVRDEFPELRLLTAAVEADVGRSPRALRARLKVMSDRFHGAHAIAMRRDPVPHAYRVFFRHIGLDPDATRTPIEAAAVDRLMHGGFQSRSRLDDALLIALVETGVPIWALDDARLDGPLGIAVARAGERLGRHDALADDLPEGRLVVADAAGPVAVLFGALAAGHGVTRETDRIRLFSVQVAGVPAIHVEEAMWACASALVGA